MTDVEGVYGISTHILVIKFSIMQQQLMIIVTHPTTARMNREHWKSLYFLSYLGKLFCIRSRHRCFISDVNCVLPI